MSVSPEARQRAYRRHAWLASAGLVLFLLIYLGSVAWLGHKAWQLFTMMDAHNALLNGLAGGAALILAAFMLQGVFFLRKASYEGMQEIKPADDPALFQTLHALADELKAPRPYRVFLSPEVTAAVMYDLSLLNLLLPSRKNLVLGLGLINGLDRAEIRAVLAHEFGHFAQRTMALGRWVYVLSQVVGGVVYRRGVMDKLVDGVSSLDIRLAWAGWILRVLAWAMRAMVETLFRGLYLLERALGREMEFQADQVAAEACGSDAIVHALYRLTAVDDAFGRALNFTRFRQRQGHALQDLYAVQSEVLSLMGRLMDNPHHGQVPPNPGVDPAQHRVFDKEWARTPEMWRSHPSDADREAHAKTPYRPGQADTRSGWTLFSDPARWRQALTALAVPPGDAVAEPVGASLGELRAEFEQIHLRPEYRGLYWDRRTTLSQAEPADCLEEPAQVSVATLATLYPEALQPLLKQLRESGETVARLEALASGLLSVGVVKEYEGERLNKAGIRKALAKARERQTRLEERLAQQDRHVRGVHRALARRQGDAWLSHHESLVALLHFAEHSLQGLRAAHGQLQAELAAVQRVRKVTEARRQAVIRAGHELWRRMDALARPEGEIILGASVSQDLGVDNLDALLGDWTLTPPSAVNLAQWLDVIDGWTSQFESGLRALAQSTLLVLLAEEDRLRAAFVRQEPLPAPPQPQARVGLRYERWRQAPPAAGRDALTFWERIMISDGWLPGSLRTAMAVGVLAVALGATQTLEVRTLHVVNGLAQTVRVQVADQVVQLAPGEIRLLTWQGAQAVKTQARLVDGTLIESFEGEVSGGSTHVYNVAGSTALFTWKAVYGADAPPDATGLGAPRWHVAHEDDVLTEPPGTVKSKRGQVVTRVVLAASPGEPMSEAMAKLPDEAARKAWVLTHLRWDPVDSPDFPMWTRAALAWPELDPVVSARLAKEPQSLVWWRLRVDRDGLRPDELQARCADAQQSLQDEGSRAYMQARCAAHRDPARMDAYAQAYQRHPDQPWLQLARARQLASESRFQEAGDMLDRLQRTQHRPLADLATEDLLRLSRLEGIKPWALAPSRLTADVAKWEALAQEPQAQGTSRIIADLARGSLAEAWTRSRAQQSVQLSLLAASSEAAEPAWGRQWLDEARAKQPDMLASPYALALAAREGQLRGEALRQALAQSPQFKETPPQLVDFLVAVASGQADPGSDKRLAGVQLELRGLALNLAQVMLRDKTPPAWRRQARAPGGARAPARPFHRPPQPLLEQEPLHGLIGVGAWAQTGLRQAGARPEPAFRVGGRWPGLSRPVALATRSGRRPAAMAGLDGGPDASPDGRRCAAQRAPEAGDAGLAASGAEGASAPIKRLTMATGALP